MELKMRYITVLVGFSCFGVSAQQKVIDFVQPFYGTVPSIIKSTKHHAEGGTENLANTIPSVALPFAMTQWTPQTRTGEQKCNAPFYFNDPYFSGIRGTHWLSGSCVPDYGSFTIMPTTGKLMTSLDDYKTIHDTHSETVTPAYYRVDLHQYKIKAEVTPTLRGSIMQFTANTDDNLHILITPNSDAGKGYVKVDKIRHRIYGYNPVFRIYQGWGKPAGFSGYFVIQFEKEFDKNGTWCNDKISQNDSISNQKNIGAFVSFKVKKGEVVRLKIGTSFTSINAAQKNMNAEIPDWDFNIIKKKAENIWENALSGITITTPSLSHKKIFYTAMFHTMLVPRLANDVDGSYPMFAHQYQTGKIVNGAYYDDFAMWDIYRAELPLLEIINPKLTNDFVRSLILKGQQGTWLPIFPCWESYTSAMIGDHVTAFIASACQNGIRDYDLKEAYRLMRQNAFDLPDEIAFKDGKGRRGLASYLKYNYIPLEDSIWEAFHKREQVSRTLEYAYDDYCLSKIAKLLNKQEDYIALTKRSKSYINVFDSSKGFMNGRYADGRWGEAFDPDKKLSFVTEATPRQYSFYVPHDVEGLINLMGGQNKMESALDSLFIKQQYWQGNEQGQQIPFLYNYTHSPWKTQAAVNKILKEEYYADNGGLSGNDDAGQMSAWYIFASIGFYPVDPASGKFQITSPLFDAITIRTSANHLFRIKVRKETPHSIFIRSIKLNEKNYTKKYITYRDIVNGGTMEFVLSDNHEK